MTTLGECIGGAKRIVGGPFGSNLTQADYAPQGVPVIRGSNMEQCGRWIGGDFAYVSQAKAWSDLKSNIARPGDIIVTQRGTMGQSSMIPDDAGRDFVLSQSQMAISVDPNFADRNYVYYYLKSPQFIEYLDSSIIQTGVPHINLGILRNAPANWPDLHVQQAIASILSALDDKIELNRRMNETLEAMARAIFKDWFVDFGPTRAKMEGRAPYLATDIWSLFPDRLDEEGKPAGWKLTPLSDLIEVNPPESLPRGKPAPYLDMASLPTVGPNPDPYVLREFGSGMRFRNGDTLLARITPCLENGKAAFVQGLPEGETGWGSTEYIVLRARPPIPAAVAYLIARDPVFRTHAIRSMTGTSGRQRASNDAISTYPLAKPQNEALWGHLDEIIAPMFARIAANARENETLAATRDLLLPKLMSGELRLGGADNLGEEGP